MPRNKTELQKLLRTKDAVTFHKYVCATCHDVPNMKEWLVANETEGEIIQNFDNLMFNKKKHSHHFFVLEILSSISTFKLFFKKLLLLDLGVFSIGKRTGKFVHWEPFYIGTRLDPPFDERLSWEGQANKMTQGYALCALDYEFLVLDNAFLVHKPGIKVFKKDEEFSKRSVFVQKTNRLIRDVIFPEYKVLFGYKEGCSCLWS